MLQNDHFLFVYSFFLLKKMGNILFDTIPILAVWPVLVSYPHFVVGILVGITDYKFNVDPEIEVFLFSRLRRIVPYFYDTLAALF